MNKKLISLFTLIALCYVIIYEKFIYTQNQLNQNFINQEENSMVDIGISEKNRQLITTILRRLLSNIYIVYIKTRNYHWNIEGQHFPGLHKMFEEQYEALEKFADEIAERIRALGFFSIGTLQEFLQYTTLTEEPGVYRNEQGMLKNLILDYETIIKELRADAEDALELGDIGTNNFLIDLIEKLEKTAWMLRSITVK